MKREKKRANVFLKGALAALMALSCIPGSGLTTVVEAAESDNLALNKNVTVSHYYDQETGNNQKFIPSHAVDGDLSTRWASEGDNQYNGSLTVDLGSATAFNKFEIYFEEGGAATVTDYLIEGSNNADSGFVELYNAPEDLSVQDAHETVVLPETETYQYVRITINVSGYPSASLREFEIYNDETASTTPANVNLAYNKPVEASAEDGTMPASNLTDDDPNSRWSAEANAVQWAYVDLGESYDMNYFSVIWESASVYASSFNIYVSDDPDNWGTAVATVSDNATRNSEVTLDEKAHGRYVKLEVTQMHGYPSVSATDFQVMLKDSSQTIPQDPEENVALGKTGYASSQEASDLNANKAFDGDRTTRSSRWSSNVGNAPHWLYVDLGDVKDVKTVRLYWETRKATNYQIEISNDASQWIPVKVMNQRPTSTTDTITLDDVQKARYVRLYISASDAEDPDGGVEWNSISVYEMEVYGGTPAISMGDIGNMISVTTPTIESKKLEVTIPEVEGYTVTYNGTDLEQVIDDDLTIYHPVVDKEVNVSFKIVNDETEDYEFKEIAVTVPGTYQSAAGDNEAPAVLPELQEWKGGTGNFTLTDSSKKIGRASCRERV